MPSRQSIPRIRVDLLDGPLRSVSASSTLDIRDILNQVKPWPNLLAEDLMLDDADHALCWEDGRLQDVPSFPVGRQPPIFILHSYRTRLPFPIHPEAFEMGDFYGDEEDGYPLLTAPTIPRMKLMIMEQLYVQKWVDTLTSDNPPKHIPWSCEKPATERGWIAEGSIFPADMVKISTERRPVVRKRSGVSDTMRFSARADHVSHSGELCAFSGASAVHAITEFHTSTSHVPAKSADVDPDIFRGESKIPRSIRTSQARSPPISVPPGLPIGKTSSTPDASLAARRGKLLGGLELKGSVIEQLEYPDIPTAFRGSPSVWSPRSEAFPVPSFTDHQSMLLDLRLKCAALECSVSTYVPGNLRPWPETTHHSLDVDEWPSIQGLATFDHISGLVDHQTPEITADTNVFLPNHSSTPTKGLGCTARIGFARPCAAVLQSTIQRSSDPPGVPLPPRPALVNPSTPPHVRGILKKVKSVRFEDVIATEPLEVSYSPPRVSADRLSPQHLVVFSRRPCTPMPNTAKLSNGPAPAKEAPMFGRNAEKSAPRSRPPPKRAKASGRLQPIHPNAGAPPETSKSSMVAASVERPCRIARAKKNTGSAAVLQAQTRQKGLSVTETDVRRGIEGTTKSRLSAPLRNIFRLR